MKVIVKDKIGRGGEFYECQPTPGGFKCGRCLRGVVAAREGAQCRVCGCRVAQIVESGEITLPGWPLTPNEPN